MLRALVRLVKKGAKRSCSRNCGSGLPFGSHSFLDHPPAFVRSMPSPVSTTKKERCDHFHVYGARPDCASLALCGLQNKSLTRATPDKWVGGVLFVPMLLLLLLLFRPQAAPPCRLSANCHACHAVVSSPVAVYALLRFRPQTAPPWWWSASAAPVTPNNWLPRTQE